MTKFEYSPALESTSVVNIKPSYDLFINNEFVASKNGSKFQTINPATEQVLAEITAATAEDVDIAVKAARKAFKSLSKLAGS